VVRKGTEAEEGIKKMKELPAGYRFHPSDEELISYYLINKISDSAFTAAAIAQVDLNKFEPWELPGTLPILYDLSLFQGSRST